MVDLNDFSLKNIKTIKLNKINYWNKYEVEFHKLIKWYKML